MASHPKLSLNSGTRLTDATEYRSAVGSLQYLAFTRPDISYAVNKLSQFMHAPTTDHWSAVKRVLRYLAGTTSHGLYFSRQNPSSLHAYSDADWAEDSDDFVSTNAYIIYLGRHPISWSSKKQKGVACSSTEAEYRSVANTSAELRWICSLLTELGINITGPPVIYYDNVGATYLCANPVFISSEIKSRLVYSELPMYPLKINWLMLLPNRSLVLHSLCCHPRLVLPRHLHLEGAY